MGVGKSFSVLTVGVFRVVRSDGVDVTPPGARPRALLAVVALSPRRVAARRWLESLFWSDRGAEQASGSLRQALTSIRKSLGEHCDVLIADRLEVGLDASRIKVDLEADPKSVIQSLKSGANLFDGLDVPTNPFEEWLRQTRNHWNFKISQVVGDDDDVGETSVNTARDESAANTPQTGYKVILPPKPILITESKSSNFQLEPFFAEAISAQVARTASEHVNVSVISVDGRPTQAVSAPGGRCTLRVTQNGDKMLVLAKLSRVPSGETLWSRQTSFERNDELAAIDAGASLALEATEAFASCIGESSDASLANSLAMSAMQHVFSFDPDRLRQADVLLKKAQELDSHSPWPALRALAKAFLAVECSVGDIDELREDARLLVRQALKSDENNALALAFLADVQDIVFNNPQLALSFAERSLKIDPGVGYAHASLGGLELKRGRNREAFNSADRARRQLENTSLQVFSNMRFCLAAMNVGDFSAACRAAENASILAPNSRPPLRHLYVLKLHAGELEGAKMALDSLRKLEPDFSLARIRDDLDYPADTIRRVGLDKLNDIEV